MRKVPVSAMAGRENISTGSSYSSMPVGWITKVSCVFFVLNPNQSDEGDGVDDSDPKSIKI